MKIAQYMLIFAFILGVSSVDIYGWKLRNGSQYYDIQFTFTDVCDPNDLSGPNAQEITEVLKAGGAEYSRTMCGEYKGLNPFSVPDTLSIKRYGIGSSVSWPTTINCKKVLNDIIEAKRNDQTLRNIDPTWVVVETTLGWDIMLDWNHRVSLDWK